MNLTEIATSRHFRGVFLITASAACWGLGTVMSKGVIAALPPMTLLAVQLTTSVLLLWVLAAFQRQIESLKRYSWRTWMKLGAPGIFEPGLSYGFGLAGLALSSASQAALIGAMEPVFILGLAWLLLRERISRPLLILSGIAIVGVVLTVESGQGSGNQVLLGNALLILGTACAGFYGLCSRKAVMKHSPLVVSALQQTVGLVCILLFSLLFRSGLQVPEAISMQVWLTAAFSGVVQYALAFWLYLIALQLVPLTIASQFLSLIPVFGISGSYLFLGERFTIVQGLGMLLVIGAVSQIARLQSHEKD